MESYFFIKKGKLKKHIMVSVIVPVYNSEKYLMPCFNSILTQTQKLEIFFINDGSFDKSLDILTDFKQKNNFVNVLNQANSKQAIARNNGILNSRSKYINTYFPRKFICK